eukprot:1136571-Pelagomonas_calceolata.AAC.2
MRIGRMKRRLAGENPEGALAMHPSSLAHTLNCYLNCVSINPFCSKRRYDSAVDRVSVGRGKSKEAS